MKLFDYKNVIDSAPEILSRLPFTLLIALTSYLIALVIAFASALVKIYNVRILKNIVNVYVSVMRSVPLIIMLYLVSYGIPRSVYYFQITYGWFQTNNPALINPSIFAVIAFSLSLAAYLTEDIRTSIQAVGEGQFEAAKSVGMTTTQMIIRIIMPQTMKIAVPMLGNTLVTAVKSTSFLFLVGIKDLISAAKVLGLRKATQMELYIFSAAVYWCICFIIEKTLKVIENRLRKSDRTMAANNTEPAVRA